MTSPVRQQSRRLAALVAIGALVAGCTGDGDEITLPSPEPSPSATEEAAASPSPAPTDPFAVPNEITADYVERVLNELNRLDAELTLAVLDSPVQEDALELPPAIAEKLTALYAPPIEEFNRRALLDLLRSPDQRDDLLPTSEYGQQRASVEELILDEGPCVVARITTDLSETDAEIDPSKSPLSFSILVKSMGSNPAGWKLSRSLGGDVEKGSTEEEEIRALTANDLRERLPEVCS